MHRLGFNLSHDQLPRLPECAPAAQMLSGASKREPQLLFELFSEAQSSLLGCPGVALRRLAPSRSPESWRRLQLLMDGDVEHGIQDL